MRIRNVLDLLLLLLLNSLIGFRASCVLIRIDHFLCQLFLLPAEKVLRRLAHLDHAFGAQLVLPLLDRSLRQHSTQGALACTFSRDVFDRYCVRASIHRQALSMKNCSIKVVFSSFTR